MNAVDSWNSDVWSKFNGRPAQNGQPVQPGLLKSVMTGIRIAQKVFGATIRGNDNPVSADTVDLKTGVPSAGLTKPVVTITKSFQLRDVHARDIANLTLATNQVTLAGQTLALVEEMLFYSGKKAALPPDVLVATAADLDDGLLGKAVELNRPIDVPQIPKAKGVRSIYGLETLAAVTAGISQFTAKLQGPPYALILDPNVFADTQISLQDSSNVTPATAIQALVNDGGFYMSPGMPAQTGLLVSLGGAATTLYVGTEPVVEFNIFDKGLYAFTARQSIQFHTIEPRSLIRLDFK